MFKMQTFFVTVHAQDKAIVTN